MANSALTIHQLSLLALNVGLGQGFNCVSVQTWTDMPEFSDWLIFTFGPYEVMKDVHPSRTAREWARSYDLDIQCIRDPKVVKLPNSVRFDASYDIQSRLTALLLELAA